MGTPKCAMNQRARQSQQSILHIYDDDDARGRLILHTTVRCDVVVLATSLVESLSMEHVDGKGRL